MFDATRKAEIYEEALELLSDPKINNRLVWVHDYGQEVYRTGGEYTLVFIGDILMELPKALPENF